MFTLLIVFLLRGFVRCLKSGFLIIIIAPHSGLGMKSPVEYRKLANHMCVVNWGPMQFFFTVY